MSQAHAACTLLATLLAMPGCFGWTSPSSDAAPPAEIPSLRLETVLSGLRQPVAAVHGQDGLLYVAEQEGTIRRWDGHEALLFLDLRPLVKSGGERGLLGLAFDPADADGRFVVDYTDARGDTVVASYRGHAGSESRPGTLRQESILLRIPQPYSNHNGGMVAFGPDGHLYVGTGDGGAAGDPHDNARDPESLLGKILRIAVVDDPCGGCANHTVPPGNPFASPVWATGLRNPWRFSFDRLTGDLWIGDVGQGEREEIDFQPAASTGGEDYGWSGLEGTLVHRADRVNPDAVPPVWEYDHSGGNVAVTGGVMYRGSAIPALNGTYLYADYGSGKLWGLRPGPPPTNFLALSTGRAISSFGEDPNGEVYVVDHAGFVLRLVPA